MKSNTRKITFVAASMLLAGSVSVASAAGLLGQRYAAATFDWAIPDDNVVNGIKVEDGHGLTLALNQPLTSNIDLSLTYGFIDSGLHAVGEGEGSADLSSQDLMFGATFYKQMGTVKPFASVSLGWLGTTVAGDRDDDTAYSLAAGVEVPAGAKASLTLYTSWTDTTDHDFDEHGLWDFGALADFEVTQKWSVLTRVSLNEHSDFGASLGALFRF